MKTLAQAKKEIKALGYSVTSKKYSDFIALTVKTKDEEVLNHTCIKRETYEKEKAFFAWLDENKGGVFEGMTPVII